MKTMMMQRVKKVTRTDLGLLAYFIAINMICASFLLKDVSLIAHCEQSVQTLKESSLIQKAKHKILHTITAVEGTRS